MKTKLGKKGFTLIEVMIASSIVSVLTLIGYSALKTSTQAGNIKEMDYEVNHLRNLVISKFSDAAVCSANFATATAINNPHKTPLVDKNAVPFLQEGGQYGFKKIVTVDTISTSRPLANGNTFTIKVDYHVPGGGLSPTPGVGKEFKVGKKRDYSFTVDIYAQFDSIGGTAHVTDCFFDVPGSIAKAVKSSCYQSTPAPDENATFYENPSGSYPYGRCLHNVQVADQAGAIISSPCPANQFLQSTTSSGGVITFHCSAFSTSPCPAWSYVKSVSPSGVPDCHPLSEIFSSGYVIATNSGAYNTTISVAQISCPTDKVLQKYNTSGPTCVPKLITKTCPVNQYISQVDTNGNLTCTPFKKTATTCPAGQYIDSVTSLGNITCKPLTINASCPAGTFLSAADSNGNATRCVPDL